MSYLSHEEAVEIEKRREDALRKRRVTSAQGIYDILIRDFPELKRAAERKWHLGWIRDTYLDRLISDFLDATEPGSYTEAVESALDRDELTLHPKDMLKLTRETFFSSGFDWRVAQNWNDSFNFEVGVIKAAVEGNLGTLDRFFDNSLVDAEYRDAALRIALTMCERVYTCLDLGHRVTVKPLQVVEMPDSHKASRNALRVAASTSHYDMMTGELAEHLHACLDGHLSRDEQVQSSKLLYRIRHEMGLRSGIFDALTDRGVSKIIAKEVTFNLRGKGLVSISDAEADSYANGWKESKNLTASLVASLMGVETHIAESALRLEALRAA